MYKVSLIFALLLAAASARPLLSNQFGNDQIGGVEKQGFEKFPGVSGAGSGAGAGIGIPGSGAGYGFGSGGVSASGVKIIDFGWHRENIDGGSATVSGTGVAALNAFTGEASATGACTGSSAGK